jgi:hypothetical protein
MRACPPPPHDHARRPSPAAGLPHGNAICSLTLPARLPGAVNVGGEWRRQEMSKFAVLIAALTFLQWIGGKLIFRNSKFSFMKACTTSVVVILMLFTLVTLDQPWLPAEIVTLDHKVVTDKTEPLKSMSQRPVAFVLGEETGRVELLINDDRNIIYVDAGDVVSREICNLNDNPMGSVPLFECKSSEVL